MAENGEKGILVVDDEEWVRLALQRLLESKGYSVLAVADGKQAAETIEGGAFDCIVLDQKIRGVNGIDLLKTAKAQEYDPAVLILTAYGTVETAVEAIKLGAFDYLTKPLDSKRILLTVQQAVEQRRLRGEVMDLRKQIGDTYGRRHIVCAGPAMKKILELVETIARTDSTVLIEGESGTGKEIIARAIHYDGPNAKKPFITVNCGSIPEQLFESELFGHVKGAFTGASKDKPGLLEEAEEGTILLDEIGDMPLPVQVKLLRVLQNGELRRVGSTVSKTIRIRTIASTNKDLRPRIEEGLFREDLFYRLNVMPVKVPALRERKEDIVPLVQHFVTQFNEKLSRNVKGVLPEAFELLLEYDWPGNVRELENFVERTVALVDSEYITAGGCRKSMHMDSAFQERNGNGGACAEKRNAVTGASRMLEKTEILRLLETYGWDREETARSLGVSRTTLWRRMKHFGIEKPC